MRLLFHLQIYCVIISVFLYDNKALSMEFKENGYDISVAIHRDVPENADIITQLTTMLESASDYLYTTTRKYLYIRSVTIIVPETWTPNPAWRRENNITFSDADIRVDFPHPTRGNNPYTFNPGQCGEEGKYIHLTPDFVLDSDKDRDGKFGNAGRVIVHEFAHLRFGVFDEYGIPGSSKHPVFYIDDTSSRVKPTACSRDVTGNFVNLDEDRRCNEDDFTTKPPSDKCRFRPRRSGNTATASVMFAQYLEEVMAFCESETDDIKLLHNDDAPNLHNKMCMGKGTWNVIRDHPDVRFSASGDIDNRQPNFRVAYRQSNVNGTRVCGRRLVLVLDVSKSMVIDNSTRYFRLRQVADRIIRDILPVGTEVGIVVFASYARIWSNMMFLTSPPVRDKLAQDLPKYGDFDGTTAIGQGLQEAIKLLQMNGKSTEKARLFLITDGEELNEPFVEEVMPDIIRANLIVHTMAYSDSADRVLRKLSEQTGDRERLRSERSRATMQRQDRYAVILVRRQHFEPAPSLARQFVFTDESWFCSHFHVALTMDYKYCQHSVYKEGNILSSTKQIRQRHWTGQRSVFCSDISLCEGEDAIEIDRRAVLLTSTKPTFEKEILIDSTIGNNTFFVFTLSKDAETEITLEDPSGNVIGASSTYYSKDDSLNIVRYLIPLAQVGTWKYKLKHGSNKIKGETIVSVVNSHARGGEQPFQVETWKSSSAFDFTNGTGLVVYVYVHKGYAPVLSAKVEVKATLSDQEPSNSDGKDDGILPDNTADDGVYTTFLVGFRKNSRYSMEVKVESAGETFLLKSGNLLSGRALTVYPSPFPKEVLEPVERFSRTASGGAIDVTGYNPSLDQLDPGRITDLDTAILDKVKLTVTLTWTAPGDDLNTGTVERYDLRIAKSFKDLRSNFGSEKLVESKDILNGSLNPLPAGVLQRVVIRLPSDWSHDVYVFGLKAFDEADRSSGLSNLRSITFKPLIIPGPSPISMATGGKSNRSTLWICIGVGVTILNVVLLDHLP